MPFARRRVLFLIVFALAALVALPAAEAGFPGTNGLIAYTCGANICKTASDGSSQGTLVTGASQPAWAKGGAKIAYVKATGIVWAPVDSGGNIGTETLLSGTAGATQPAWSPDGTQLAYVQAGDIWTNNTSGTAPVNRSASTLSDVDPNWSPDGSEIAF